MTKIQFDPLLASEKQRADIVEAIRIISAKCDGARDLDGEGFNKFDAEAGHHLASLSLLSSKQLTLAARLAFKYKRQLDKGLRDSIEGIAMPQKSFF